MNLSSIRDPVLQLPAPGITLVSETGQLALESSSKEQTDRQESSRPEVDALRAHSHSPVPVKWAQQGSISPLTKVWRMTHQLHVKALSKLKILDDFLLWV